MTALVSGPRTVVLTIVLGIVLLPRVSWSEDYDPFKFPRAQVRERLHVVAMRPAFVPHLVDASGSAAALLEAIATDRLERAGVEVVASPEFERHWLAASERLEGVFDPITGKPDEKKTKAAFEHIAREMEGEQGVDGFIRLWVSFDVFLPYRRNLLLVGIYAAAGEDLLWNGKTILEGDSFLSMPQRVEGTRLSVSIHDLNGVLLYDISMPLQWTTIYKDRSHQERPAAELFEGARTGKVVDELLAELIETVEDRN
jgi:hypothetical protein